MSAASTSVHPSDESPVYAVLGATGGLGSALARRLAADGARVVLGSRNAEALQALADEVGGVAVEVDAADFDQVEALLEQATGQPGRFAGIANCAGSLLLKPAHLTTRQELDETLAANLISAFATVRAAAPKLRRDGGSIVLVASAAAEIGLANHDAIAAAKAGVAGLVRSAATTYGGKGVRVNAVAPGLMATPMTERIVDNPKALEASLALHAIKRPGEPEEVAGLIAWLLGADSGWVTGQVWGIDGGLARVKGMR